MPGRTLSLARSRFYVFTSYSWRRQRAEEGAEIEGDPATVARAFASWAVTGANGQREVRAPHDGAGR